MTIENLQTLIGSLGFPIVAYLLNVFTIQKALNNNTAAINELKEEMSKNG